MRCLVSRILEIELRKNAADPIPEPVSGAPNELEANNQLKINALKTALGIFGISAAAGAGIRSMVGARGLFGRPSPGPLPGPSVINIPYPVYRKNRRDREVAKEATGFMERLPGEPANELRGDNAFTMKQIPLSLPIWTLAGIGGGVGGYHLANWALGRKRKSELNEEVEQAKTDYQQALLSQYDPAKVHTKLAAGEELGNTLNQLYDALTKQAGSLGTALGVYGALATALGLGSGYLSYQHFKERGQNKLLEEAIRQRERERWARRPPDVQAVPVPVHATRGGLKPIGSLPNPEDDEPATLVVR